MTPKTLFTLVCSGLIAGSLLAGPQTDYKQVAPAPPPCDIGTGWYFALDGGANVYQSFDDSFDRSFPNGDKLHLKIDHNVGGYGGLKFGYVFGRGNVRFALEEDMFYNGLSTSAHVDLNNQEVAKSSNMINSGAFLTNFIVKFPIGNGKFQPYVGAGVGAYYAEAGGGDVTFTRRNRTFSTAGGSNSGSLAWDVVAGADYYWTCKFSTFVEYHYLDYVALDVGDGNHSFGQHLVGAGIKFHF
jgi:opacity protein-like surface antigen